MKTPLRTRTRILPAQYRIRKRREFLNIQGVGNKASSGSFLLCWSAAEQSRIGVTVTTKVDKRAVRRNRLKRLVREFFRLNRSRINGNYDIVVIARNSAVTTSNDKLRRELAYLFYKAQLFPGKEHGAFQKQRGRAPERGAKS
ncbi:MAG: ribonuclease P protein component [bacterium]|nr:ribonuclease P protein component [bacterium]